MSGFVNQYENNEFFAKEEEDGDLQPQFDFLLEDYIPSEGFDVEKFEESPLFLKNSVKNRDKSPIKNFKIGVSRQTSRHAFKPSPFFKKELKAAYLL